MSDEQVLANSLLVMPLYDRHPRHGLSIPRAMTAIIVASVLLAGPSAPVAAADLATTTTTVANEAVLATDTIVGDTYSVEWSVTADVPEAGTPTGTVTVTGDGNCAADVAVGRCDLTSGEAGAKTLVATYSGDAIFAASASGGTGHTVVLIPTSTALERTSTDAVTDPGTAVVFRATVTGTSTGSVEFFEGGSVSLGSVTLDELGQASLSVTTLPEGTNEITASFPGDATHATSSSSAVTHTVRSGTATTVTTSPSTSDFGETFTVTVDVSPAPPDGTTVTLRGYDPAFTRALDLTGGLASWDVSDADVGKDVFRATFAGTSEQAASTGYTIHSVRRITTTMLNSSLATSEVGRSVTLTATVQNAVGGGTVEFTEGSTILGTVALGSTATASMSISSLAVGEHVIVAVYLGDTTSAASRSEPFSQIVVADTEVRATALRLGYPIFYPYRDGFRDAMPVLGTLLEPAGVSIRVFDPAGTRILNVSLGEREGPYRYLWSGLRTTGAMYPAGTYRVTQTLTDRGGHRLTTTLYADLSRRSITYYTRTYDRTGSAFTSFTETGGADVSTFFSDYPSGVDLDGGCCGEVALVEYGIALPAADDYKSLALTVTGKPFQSPDDEGGSTVGRLMFGFWDWSIGQLGPSSRTGTYAGAYTMATTKASIVSPTARARAILVAYGDLRAHWDVQKIRIVLTYGVLN